MPIPESLSADLSPLKLARSVLGGGRGSRLTRRLRYERGLVYSVQAHLDRYPEAACLTVTTSCGTEAAQEVVDIVLQELRRLAEVPVSSEELLGTQERLLHGMPLELQTVQQLVQFHRYHEVQRLDEGLDSWSESIVAATSSSIQSSMSSLLAVSPPYVSLAGDIPAEPLKF